MAQQYQTPISVNAKPDGTTIGITPDGAWDLTLPSGKHIRGNADTPELAQTAAQSAYERQVLRRWERGTISRGKFICPLE